MVNIYQNTELFVNISCSFKNTMKIQKNIIILFIMLTFIEAKTYVTSVSVTSVSKWRGISIHGHNTPFSRRL
jgi:hypothetical protein